ncbi:uncharacterized protein LOC127852735 [Dreissena polymorpha]|uniref:uncharacterized protein LOC127852735 n=1 Tax=Dreissena polymorpha TaxID=45954 RepID=UPI00226510C8|nr:uncharacterized protein LOC127852735 [Dreissena polymorpha]
MDQEAHKSLIEWKPINERRVMSARFNSAYAKLTIIVCYAPTEVAEATEKDAFYDQLQEVIESTQKHDVLLVLGDLNANVGKDNTGGLPSTEVPVKNLQGEIVSTDVKKVSCWKEHFERVLNSADPSTEAVIAPAEIPLNIDTEPPTIQEIRQAIKKLKNGKAPDFSVKVICEKTLTENLEIRTGVKQGCALSPLLFSLCIDWLMKETIKDAVKGLQWTFTETLEDPDFADDIALLAQRNQDIQTKTDKLDSLRKQIGLNIKIKRKRWRWIGHVRRMEETAISKVAMRWTPIGRRQSGRPKET